MIKRTDEQLQALTTVAARLPSASRDAFLRKVSTMLHGQPVDDETTFLATVLGAAHAFEPRERGSRPTLVARGNRRKYRA
jgi:hypothetical protein